MTERIVRWSLAIAGGFAMAYGIVLVLTKVSRADWLRLTRWGLSAWLLNDLVLMPTAMVLGVTVLRRIPRRRRTPLRGALLGSACLVIMTAVAIGARAHQKNPTAEVTPPLVALLITGGVLAVVTAIAELLAGLQRPKRDEGPASD